MMGRSPNCRSCSNDDDHQGFIRGAWTAKEDTILSEYIKTHGVGRWRSLPKKAGLKRCGKSCRLRWLNYLRPDINHGNISPEEEELLIRLHRLLGNRWSLIAGRLPGRTDNEIKNYWNTHLRKKVEISELEPKSQKPFKSCRDMPYYSDYKEQEVKDKDNSISQTTPLKTRSVRYCGRVIADVNNCNNDNYDLIQDAHGGINPQEKGLKATDDHVVEVDTSKSFKVADDHVVEIDTSKSFKAEDDHVVEIDTSRSFKAADNHGVDIDTSKSFKVADDHVVEIDTSKSWCQLLLEDCIGDEKYDRLEVIDGLQKNNIVRTQSLGIEDHLHAQFPYPTHNYEIHSSYYSSFEDQEFPHSIYFESFLDLSELPSFLS